MAPERTNTSWDHEYNTLRREKLFRNPPTDQTAYPALQLAVDPHIESFNALFRTDGTPGLLDHALAEIGTKTFLDGDDRAAPAGKNKLTVRYKSVTLQRSQVPPSNKFAKRREIFPAECRERHVSYRGKLTAVLEFSINDGEPQEFVRELGQMPIMVKSNKCHLENNSPALLVQRKEESEELGGYFVVNGIEKIIRLLLVNRRNFPLAIIRPSFTNRGSSYTPYGIITNVLHYLNDGNYLVPTNDREIFEGLNTFLTDRVELLLRTYKTYGLYTKTQTRAYLGEKFRVVLGVPDTMSDYEVGTEFLRRIVLVNLGCVDTLLFMCRKLYALVAGDCAVDNPDAVQNQEILLGGFLYGMVLKERLDELLRNPTLSFTSSAFAKDFPISIFKRTNENLGNALDPSGLDLQQTSGFTVVAEKLNFLRFISHFRMTTTVRKLLPESWGFLCPVHTPDGSPCGLLNHMAHKCKIMTDSVDASAIQRVAMELGVNDYSSAATSESVVVMLDGRIIGWCTPKAAKAVADSLRRWKVEGGHGIPVLLEIGYVPPSKGGSYPGIYMSSQPSRMVRPVKYLPLGKEDFVGPHEQPYMSIACTEGEILPGDSTHVEFDPTNILSILANMTPFSDFNQSPRNMYQCQMGKQTMGTPGTALRHRTDNKMYRLQTGQTPIVRAPLHNTYGFDNFPNGMNAVVAVISYTGYDMDDAMILNKSAHERGFGHGTIYKTKKVSLKDDTRTRTSRTVSKMFGFAPGSPVRASDREMLDEDGLPYVGRLVREGDILCAWHTVSADYSGQLINRDGITHWERYREAEDAFIEEVRVIGSDSGNEPLQTISIKLRIPRSPVIGDKFSSRHGQKGVASQKWPAIDMPFSETGIQPDVIINPHAFPSRMTIGMFVESLAGKAGALHGLAQDSTPFKFNEEHTAGDYFGHQLMKAGYNYHGNEPMYSGITGEEFACDIYIGVVYYQRLRHMVNDKYQVRTTGPVVPTTGQPIKGRKKGGGIRVGEMERDALLAHGTAFLLQDRLLNCSDYSKSWICRDCGSFLAVQPTVSPFIGKRKQVGTVRCRNCAQRLDQIEGLDLMKLDGEIWEDGQGVQWIGGENTTMVVVPGALKFLDVELAAMGVKLKYRVDNKDAIRRGPLRATAPKALPNYAAYNYGFDVKKRAKRQLGRRGAMVVQDKTGGDIQVRQEIRQLEQDQDLWTLYILGLSMLQYTDQASPMSYYGLAGIHGMPHQTWGGVKPVAGNENTGYCAHSSVLFPTWHRPYMALYEQALRDLILMIATFWPESERQRYESAARRFRLPYWDWALEPPSGESVLPKSIGGNPFVDVNGPNGVQRIANPLFSYNFKPLDRTAFGSGPWNTWTRTLRSPSSDGPDAQSNNSLVAVNLDQNRASLAQRLYSLFSNNDNYTTFSNNALGRSDSIESLHDTIHSLVGGLGPSQPAAQPGHMAYIQWSAFDPVFFLHHCTVDRILAIWQAVHPTTWVPSSQALLNSYTTRRGQPINASTALTPFFSDDNGTFWTSDSVRDHTKFGYTYAELLRGPSTTPSNNNMAVAAQVRTTKQAVNRMYGSFSPASLFLKELRAQGFKTSHKTAKPAAAPHYSLTESKIFAGADGDRYHEWTAHVRVDKQALDRVSSINFFLGGDDDAPESTHVGTMGVFTAARYRDPTQELEMGMDHDVPVSGTVPLTAALVKKVAEGELAGLEPEQVEPYLRAHLKRVMLGSKGEVVAAGAGEECVEGVGIEVVCSEVAAPWSEEELPQWGEGRVQFEMC
ncbi:DNA-directed RNA polymerase I subunit RPA2 [Parachaetomium inaequale]|uniref:DNA-directed RNA polymerase subunit beta n=1 Tax=Parachaetomium inaequale TaxID=2588326 RepID=A0AAN6SMS8_9PEZI|nr:DNA-directed RNA polymerase I subunit RPA2 [Parachaetomium inaequale]